MYTYRAKLVRVIDGDTVDLAIDVGFFLTATVRCRMAGINTPERGHPRFAEAAIELAHQIKMRESPGGYVYVLTGKGDKYGRWLVFIGSDSSIRDTVNDAMVQSGLAVPYMVDKPS